MKRKMTKAEVYAWMRRWRVVNDFERKELRATPMETTCRQLAAMMRMARALGWDRSSDEDVKPVRHLWVRLKRNARDARRTPQTG